MLAFALAVALSSADLQRWIDDQPEVRAYEQERARGLRPPPADAFRRQPILSRAVACRGSSHATAAAVKLFKTSDDAKLMLSEPDLQERNGGQAVVQLDEAAKMALQARAREYQQDAGSLEPACLG